MNDPILFGAAYYPEAWPESERPYDIQKMKEAGMNVMRIGEFAWSVMEPREGEYHFQWLHEVIDDLAANGIQTILGTPTATPPRWFLLKHPEGARLEANGQRAPHGGRRHCCSNNPDYQRICLAIAEAMGKEFGDDPNVIGWQIDNEIYSWDVGCVCPVCEEKFHRFLEAKYGTIGNLNTAWNLNLWSQTYWAFDEIPVPKGWANPHLKLEWALFRYESDIQFIHAQADILRKYTKAPIGTDMMPVNGMGHEAMTEPLDVVQYNHYNTEENLSYQLPFWYDHFRSFGKPMWNTETATCWNGGTGIGQVMKPEGFCRINSWLPIALGAEGNLYWLWRQHSAGHELMHGSVLYATGRPMHIFEEVRQIAADYEKAKDFLRETKVQTQIGMHYTSLSCCLNQVEPIVEDFAVGEFDDREPVKAKFYKPLIDLGLRPDVLGAKKSLEGYKVVFSHILYTLEDQGLGDRIEEWVRSGGIWVAGPVTDIRNAIGAHFTDRAMGRIERMTGVQLTDSIPGNGKYLPCTWADGEAVSLNSWQELYTPTDRGEVLASVTGGYSTLVGKALIQKIPVGKGWVWLLGTVPSAEDYQKLIRMVCADADIQLPEVTGSVTVVPRSGNGREGLILLETAHQNASYVLTEPMTDILTGQKYQGKVALKPYDLLVLEKV